MYLSHAHVLLSNGGRHFISVFVCVFVILYVIYLSRAYLLLSNGGARGGGTHFVSVFVCVFVFVFVFVILYVRTCHVRTCSCQMEEHVGEEHMEEKIRYGGENDHVLELQIPTAKPISLGYHRYRWVTHSICIQSV